MEQPEGEEGFLEQFLAYVNTNNLNLSFTMDHHDSRISFFDLTVMEDKDSGRISTNNFRKKTVAIQNIHSLGFQSVFTTPIQTDEFLEMNILNNLSQMFPFVQVTDINNVTSATKSSATILKPRDHYCVGDNVTIQIDMLDYLGNRKTHGGDFIRARIHTPEIKAGASGTVEDFNNGTYHVHFTLFWEGKVHISLLLYHPSEGASALWRVRNQGYGLISFMGTFLNGSQQVKTECGFQVNGEKQCEYRDDTDVESFYCIKPEHFSCWSLTLLQSFNRQFSFLTKEEQTLFNRANIAVGIPNKYEYIDLSRCTKMTPAPNEPCRIGMESPYPSGFWLNNVWTSVFCNIHAFPPTEYIYSCFKDKSIYFMGDSTLRQWYLYIINILKELNHTVPRRTGRETMLSAMDLERNIRLQWKKHSHPFVASHYYTVKDDDYISEEIDRLHADPNTIIVITLGQHFRPFPLPLFIRRVISVRRAVERLFLRSPETKVIIKAENTREINNSIERFSDFHGYIQYLIVKDIFKDLHVGVIDAWDMTIASDSWDVHPNNDVVKSQISMLLTYVC
ncbi:NXPE family member 1-like [Pelodytes ibericus]